jgi:hypothetical protein
VILKRLAALVAARSRERPLALRLAVASQEILAVGGVSITLEAATPNRVTLSATDLVAARLEQLQDVLGEGPSWDAYRTGSPQVAHLRDDDPRWPHFTAAAREAVGNLTVYGLPMRPDGRVLGVVGLHLQGSAELTDGIESALFLADIIGAVLITDPQAQEGHDDAGPWSGRSQIQQATGMVIAQLHVLPGDALAILRAHAFAHNTTLDDIAEQVINRSLNFETDAE